MKTKVVISIGVFFVFLQFSTVLLFNQMLTISEAHKLPMQDVHRYQGLIMKTIYGSLLAWGLLSLILVIGLLIETIVNPGRNRAKMQD